MDEKIEQYKILWDLFNQEMQRFWLRYNVLIGIQIAVIVTILNSLTKNGEIDIYSILLIILILLMLSIITDGIVTRAIKIYKFNLKNIKKFENNHKKFNLLTKDNFDKLIDPHAYYLARWLTRTLLIVWIGYIIYVLFEHFKWLVN